jgi:hypothetical protein
MLQCISPHLTIDRNTFELLIAQYKRWLFRIRYACTYHHETFVDRIMKYVPQVPFFNSGSDELAPPRRDPPHTHPDFDFSWGTGPLVDSFGGMYHFNGTHTRMPGHEDVEEYDEERKVNAWTPIRQLGDTNEYIHPIVYHRSLVHGWDTHSPLQKHWNRSNWRSQQDNKLRFWWYKDGEKDICAIPEWAILRDASIEEYNFERKWYYECEKTVKTLDKLANAPDFGLGKDFLEVLDKNVDFDNKPQSLWP